MSDSIWDYITIEEMKQQVKELKEKERQERIARGLPPDPPDTKFVPVSVSIVLIEKLNPLLKYASKYATIIASGNLIEVDMEQFKKYEEYIFLLSFSKGTIAMASSVGFKEFLTNVELINMAVRNERTDDVTISKFAENLYYIIEVMRENGWHDTYDYNSDVHPQTQWQIIREEVNRLKSDESAFEEELKKARDHYESIKHLI